MNAHAAAVRRMFDAISPRYDLLNHLLSAGVDRGWRAAAAERIRTALAGRAGARVLDVCCGTGDLAFAVMDVNSNPNSNSNSKREGKDVRVVGVDFSVPMLQRAGEKAGGRALRPGSGQAVNGAFRFQAADALRLPFRDGAFDACTIAFGLRNLSDPAAGMREMRRVLRPGGWLFVLEFGRPRLPVVREAYGFYFHRVLPWIGRAVSRSGTDAYDYLPRTVAAFPDRERLAAAMEEEGFTDVAFRPLTCGIAVLYEGRTG
jgi:demethylmenaquinone methyltransferase/2-methoxy-6-polyprenyl-1,4-benzoquinol methylase